MQTKDLLSSKHHQLEEYDTTKRYQIFSGYEGAGTVECHIHDIQTITMHLH